MLSSRQNLNTPVYSISFEVLDVQKAYIISTIHYNVRFAYECLYSAVYLLVFYGKSMPSLSNKRT